MVRRKRPTATVAKFINVGRRFTNEPAFWESSERTVLTGLRNAALRVADELFAPDYVNHDGLIADLVRGPEAIKVSAALFRLAFPDLHVTVEELNTDDETVVVRWTAQTRGTEDPDGDSLAANQELVKGITRSRLAGGKIIESWTEWDCDRVLPAWGLVPH